MKGEVGGWGLKIENRSLRTGVRSRHVETDIKRFLSIEVRNRQGVLVGGGELRLVELEDEEEEGQGRGRETGSCPEGEPGIGLRRESRPGAAKAAV